MFAGGSEMGMRRVIVAFALGTVHLLLVALAAPLFGGSAEAQVTVTGQWTRLPYTMPINPIHVGLLHNGKVLVVAGSEGDPTEHDVASKAAVWDLQAGTIAVQELLWDVFCNGMAFLPDGRALIIGGTEQYDPFTGEARATVFDPVTEAFAEVESMAHGRWYGTAIPMSDGQILAFSGFNETGNVNNAVELYRIAYGWGPEQVAPWTPPLYPWLHLLPNGKVFYSGLDPSSHFFDPATSTWTLNVARTVYGGYRSYGTSVLLPLLPEKGYAPRVMIMGGDSPATKTAEIIDLSKPNPAWRSLPPMSLPRVQMNAVILPNGKVLASGGSLMWEDVGSASLAADLFDPVTETWSPAGVESYPRLYHSVLLLLPDATVMSAGSNPVRGTYEEHIEIWTPPYLFATDKSGKTVPAVRPRVISAPTAIGYAATFEVKSPDSSDIGSVVLVRPGSPTHSFDMEQRLVGLSFSVKGATLTVSGPPDPRIAPPGYYMLFILNRQGVPSVAKFVQVTPTLGDKPPVGTIVQPATDVTIGAGQAVTFAGSGSDSDGAVMRYAWIFPDGSPDTSLAQNPGSVTFASPGTYVASLTVVDNLGANDPSPPTRVVTVVPAAQLPAAPTGLAATASKNSTNLTWTVNSTNEDGFKVESSTDGQTFTLIGTVGAGVSVISDKITGPKKKTLYYRVRAYNAAGNSDYSNTVIVTGP
jgi:hypothetical protein